MLNEEIYGENWLLDNLYHLEMTKIKYWLHKGEGYHEDEWGSEGIAAPPFLISVTDLVKWSATHLATLTLGKEAQYHWLGG